MLAWPRRFATAGVRVEPRWNPGLRKVVGATGFEPATPCAQGRCATRLRYAPTLEILNFTAVSRSSPIRVLAFLAKIVAELSQTQFTVPELPIHHPTCPKTPIRWPHD